MIPRPHSIGQSRRHKTLTRLAYGKIEYIDFVLRRLHITLANAEHVALLIELQFELGVKLDNSNHNPDNIAPQRKDESRKQIRPTYARRWFLAASAVITAPSPIAIKSLTLNVNHE